MKKEKPFAGIMSYKLYSGGYLYLPKKFMEICKNEGGGFMVSGADKILAGYSLKGWERLIKRYDSAHDSSEAMNAYMKEFIGRAVECRCDKKERFYLPKTLIEFAGLKNDVLIIGLTNHFEIISKENWRKMQKKIETESEIARFIRRGCGELPDMPA